MKNKTLLIALIMVVFSTLTKASEEEFFWRLADGSKAPETDNQKSIDNFGGWLLVTPDLDWEEKWYRPPGKAPHFNEAHTVKIGEELTILPFFVNPKIDEDSNIEIICDVQVERPDGSFSINESNLLCAYGKLDVDPKTIFLTQTVIKYLGEEGDPFGEWTVHFVIKDNNRGVSLPLKTSFTLVE